MSAPRPITEKERELIVQSVDRAWVVWLISHEHRKCTEIKERRLVRLEDRLRLESYHTGNDERPYIMRMLPGCGGRTRHYPWQEWMRILFRLHVGRITVQSSELKAAIDSARETSNAEFFCWLAAVIAAPPCCTSHMLPLEKFLLTYWDKPLDNQPELFRFTATDLVVVCRSGLGEVFTADRIEKMRWRMGLRPCRREKIPARWKGGQFQIGGAVRRR